MMEDADTIEVYIGKKIVNLKELMEDMPVGIACDSFTITGGKVEFDFSKAKAIKLFGSNHIENGIVDAIETGEGITLNEMEYSFGAAYKRFVSAGHIMELQAGEYVELYVDRFDEIVYYKVDEDAASMGYGYLIDAGVQNKGIKRELELKIMDASGHIDIYSTQKQKFILDGKKTNVQGDSLIYSVGGSSVDLTKRQVVRFRAEEKTLIKLDTSAVRTNYEGVQNSLTKEPGFDFYAENQEAIRVTMRTIGRDYVIPDNCIMFLDEELPTATNPNEKRFSVQNASSLGGGDYMISSYDANDMREPGCIVRYTQYGNTEGTENATRRWLSFDEYFESVVEKVRVKINKDGEEGWEITLAGNSGVGKYFAPMGDVQIFEARSDSWNGWDYITVYEISGSLTDNIKSGDIIRYTTTSTGEINYIEKLFDFASNKDKLIPIPYDTGSTWCFAKVEKNSGNTVMYSEKADGTKNVYRINKNYYNQIPVYNVKEGTVSMYSYEDMPTTAKGDNVKAYLRFYEGIRIFSNIFYVYD